MITVKTQFNEKIEWIFEPESLDERVFRARTIAQMDPTFPQLIRMASVDSERLCGLPEGMPNTIKLEKDMPDGVAHTTIRQEFRRIKNFLANNDVQRLPAVKRESLWLQILEGVHYKEAQYLTMIKDRTLFYNHPGLFDVMDAFGAVVDIPREAPELPKVVVEDGLDEAILAEANKTVEDLIETPAPVKKKGRPKKAS